MNEIRRIRQDVDRLQRGAPLRSSALSDEEGNVRISLSALTGNVTAHDEAGNDVVRMGPLSGSAPGEYGVEVNVDGTWIQLGRQTTGWDQVGGKPAGYEPETGLWDPTPHKHAGDDITSAVAKAAQADGSQSAFERTVGGTEFYALWVGNDGGYKFGRNVSSAQYKDAIKGYRFDPRKTLQVAVAVFNRKDSKGREVGVIAEQAQRFVPELITRFKGKIDGFRYDLFSLAVFDVVKWHEERLKAVEAKLGIEAAAPTGAPPDPVFDKDEA